LKPAAANSLQDPSSKNQLHKKRTNGVAQDTGPESKPQYHKKKKKKKKKTKKGIGESQIPIPLWGQEMFFFSHFPPFHPVILKKSS
jgi:hypothetical protein